MKHRGLEELMPSAGPGLRAGLAIEGLGKGSVVVKLCGWPHSPTPKGSGLSPRTFYPQVIVVLKEKLGAKGLIFAGKKIFFRTLTYRILGKPSKRGLDSIFFIVIENFLSF